MIINSLALWPIRGLTTIKHHKLSKPLNQLKNGQNLYFENEDCSVRPLVPSLSRPLFPAEFHRIFIHLGLKSVKIEQNSPFFRIMRLKDGF